MKKALNILFGFVIISIFMVNINAYVGPNYATSTESSPVGLYYDGYIQVVPNYPYNSSQKYQDGWIRYYEGTEGVNDTGRLYTGTLTNGVVKRSYRYWDNLNPWAPKTQFRYGFRFTNS